MNKTDEIIKLKELLDKNIITSDDFEKLKKQIFDNQTVTIDNVILTDDEKLCPNCNKVIFISSERCGFCNTYLSHTNTEKKIVINESIIKEVSPTSIDINNDRNKKTIIVVILFLIGAFVIFYFYHNSNSAENEANKNNVTTDAIGNIDSDANSFNSFVGEWIIADGGGNVTIKSNGEITISNSVCEAYLTHKIENNELILFLNDALCKFENDYGKLANKQIGKCFIKDNALYIEISDEDMSNGMGLFSGKLLTESEYSGIEADESSNVDMSTGTDMEANINSAKQLENSDKNLNIIYKKVMAVLPENEKMTLRDEQRKWIKYRDSICEDETIDNKPSSMYNALLNNCLINKTDKRVKELTEILKTKGNN